MRRKQGAEILTKIAVSIHAPAWGATFQQGLLILLRLSFNPRTRVGCDFPSSKMRRKRLRLSFNPRTRVGCDGIFAVHTAESISVSIHAPAWGATYHDELPPRTYPGFNPRTRVGCDASFVFFKFRLYCFNPRTRVGCDFPSSKMRRKRLRFQSTHPRGVRRKQGVEILTKIAVSIHAPAWGATLYPPPAKNVKPLFQSTHPRGVRLQHIGQQEVLTKVSIHAPAWGATASTNASFISSASFNPRTRVGCDCFHVLSSRFP